MLNHIVKFIILFNFFAQHVSFEVILRTIEKVLWNINMSLTKSKIIQGKGRIEIETNN